MSNPERGEVSFEVGDRTYTLKLSMNAAVKLEKRLNKRIGQLINEAGALNFEAIRSVVWVLLQKHHAAEFKTEEQVGDLIDEAGSVTRFFDALRELGNVNRPDIGGATDENPPEAQSGTGESST